MLPSINPSGQRIFKRRNTFKVFPKIRTRSSQNLFSYTFPYIEPEVTPKFKNLVQSRLQNRHSNSDQKDAQIIYREIKIDRSGNLTALFSDSSVPGLREICHSDSYFRKIIWFIAFISLGFLALADIHNLLSEFYSYPVTVNVRLRESRKLPFPAVTVCNLNIVRYTALCNSTLNISMPLELQEKLCGISPTTLNTVNSQLLLYYVFLLN